MIVDCHTHIWQTPDQLGQMDLGDVNRDMLAVQLTAALDGPLLLYLSASDLIDAAPDIAERIAQSWQDLVQRVCRR